MSFTNPFTSKTSEKVNPFLTGKSCLQASAPTFKSSNLSSFAAFDKLPPKTEAHTKEISPSAHVQHEGEGVDTSSSDSQGSFVESHSEEYFSADHLYDSQDNVIFEVPPKKEKGCPSSKGFSSVMKEMDNLVEDVTASFRRLKTITSAVCSRTAIAPGEASTTAKQTFPVHNHFYYGKSEIAPRDVGEMFSGERALGSHLSTSVSGKAEVPADSTSTLATSVPKTLTEPSPVEAKKPEEQKGAILTQSENSLQSSLAAKNDPPRPESTVFSRDVVNQGSATLSSLTKGPLSVETTAEGHKPGASSDTEGYPFAFSIAGLWKCWRCTKAISTDELVTKLKELNSTGTNVEGQSYFLVKCDDPKCMGCKRRYFFIPNGKEPILHKDVPKTNAQQVQLSMNSFPQKVDESTPGLTKSADSSPFPSSSHSQPMMPAGNTLPSTTGMPSHPFASAATSSLFAVNTQEGIGTNISMSGKSNASKEEANSFFIQSKPQESVQQGTNPFLAARESFSAQPQSSGNQPQFGVRSAITSSFAPLQSGHTASSGPVFGNSRFQNFSSGTSLGSVNNTSLWGHPNTNANFSSNPPNSQNPNAPLNPFQQQSAFNQTR